MPPVLLTRDWTLQPVPSLSTSTIVSTLSKSGSLHPLLLVATEETMYVGLLDYGIDGEPCDLSY